MSDDQKHPRLAVEVRGIPNGRPTLNDELSLLRAVKLFPKITIYTFAVMTGILFVGFDTVIVGTITAVPRFQQDFGGPSTEGWVLPAEWVSLWSAFGPVGAVVGGIFAGWLQDRIGRRWSFAFGSGNAMVAIAVMFCSNFPTTIAAKRVMFLASKILQGSSVGIILATSQTYISEIAPVSLKGPAMALFPTFILLGQLVGAVVIFVKSGDDSPKAYLVPFATQWLFAVLPLIVSFVMPESPAWLIQRGELDHACRCQSRLLTTAVDLDIAIDQLKESIALERQLSTNTSYYDCFRGVDLRRTMIVVLASSITNFFGLPLLANASYYMQQVGMSAFLSLLFLIIGIVLGAIANGCGIWVLSKVGRRTLILSSMSITTVVWMGMGISDLWPGRVATWYTAISLMVIVVVCGVGCWPASFAVGVEAASLRLRAKSQGINIVTSQIGNIVLQLSLPYIYNVDAGNLKSKTGFVYAVLCAVGTALAWCFVPEMKDRTTAEIDHLFETKVQTRAFKSH